MFNVTLIENASSALVAEFGEDYLPIELYEAGEWTWSNFEKYLTILNNYYQNVEVADCSYPTVQAYDTDHRYAGLSAMHSAGGGIYTDAGLVVNSEASIRACDWIKSLMDKDLLVDCGHMSETDWNPGWCDGATDFSRGGTVFTDHPDWLIVSSASACSDRGEAVGMVPFPRPDDMEMDDEHYTQANTIGNSVGLLKGSKVDPRLAMQAYCLYWKTYFETLGGVSMSEYFDATATDAARDIGLDIFSEEYGDTMLNAFCSYNSHMGADFSSLLNMWENSDGNWTEIFGKSLYGIDGMPSSYSIAIEANMSGFSAAMKTIQDALSSDAVIDNRPADIKTTDAILPMGTDVESVDWTEYFTAVDSVDGDLDVASGTITVADTLDVNTAGEYKKAVSLEIADNSGNTATGSLKVIIYNGENTEPPVITVAETLPVIELETNASDIDFTSCLASAVDADGLDVMSSLKADLSTLDTTTPGEYDVVLTVTDYAGNEASVTVTLKVAAPSSDDEEEE